ncbi:predicted protein [Pyrenophora tritici-repentis Pt-1C-BFP]|uniref:F-box domain-containing protein n=1 Tax=Pyrenophora tritici-repentis (strain Pt-1C-BFP) TaxID=426418 RepID=B2W946_PYRTR|nr:uncharacterized protein PTRG_06504 [Pyrenophora tritici-repentis Pt-1C-BFP]EDU49424.1 predicted protein [Pyrenophora tritici-repentis Pt-1C-BFP]
MSDSTFSKMPTELVEIIAEYLDDEDLIAFRLSCVKLDAQTARIVGERFFSKVQTSLIGSDIQKLEQLACGRFAKYVKKILVLDDSEKIKDAERTQQEEQIHGKRRPSYRVWPLDERGDIDIDMIGFATLRNILRTCFGKDCLEEEDRSGLKIVHDGKGGRAAAIGYNGPNAARVLYTMASYARLR